MYNLFGVGQNVYTVQIKGDIELILLDPSNSPFYIKMTLNFLCIFVCQFQRKGLREKKSKV